MEKLREVQDYLKGSLEKVSKSIASIEEQKRAIIELIQSTILEVETILPSTTSVLDVGNIEILGTSWTNTKFQFNLAKFLTTALKNYGTRILDSNTRIAQKALKYMLLLSYVKHSQVFEICVEFWGFLLRGLYTEKLKPCEEERARYELPIYLNIFSEICDLVVKKMKNPADVHTWADQNNVVRDSMEKTHALLLHEKIKICLYFLTKLNRRTVEKSIEKLLKGVIVGSQSIKIVQPICWSAGAFIKFLWNDETEQYKSEFLRNITIELLILSKKCEVDHDTSVLIGTGIMYITAACPAYSNASVDSMAAVFAKILECMQSTHHEVRDVACDSLMKITKQSPKKFLIAQGNEPVPYIDFLFFHMDAITGLFGLAQFLMFCEAVSNIIAAESDASKREQFINKILEYPNQCWNVIVPYAVGHQHVFFQNGPALMLLAALKTYVLVFGRFSSDSAIKTQLLQICKPLYEVYNPASKYIYLYNKQYPMYENPNQEVENRRYEEHRNDGAQLGKLEPLLLEPMCIIQSECDKLIELRTAMSSPNDVEFLAWREQIEKVREEFPRPIEPVMTRSNDVDMLSDSDSETEM